jgi:chromosomal replication initiation ATPase DnaA
MNSLSTGVVLPKKITLSQFIQAVCQKYCLSESDLVNQGKHRVPSQARAVLAFLVKATKTLSLVELAHFLHRDLSVVSRLAIRFETERLQFKNLADEMAALQKSLI